MRRSLVVLAVLIVGACGGGAATLPVPAAPASGPSAGPSIPTPAPVASAPPAPASASPSAAASVPAESTPDASVEPSAAASVPAASAAASSPAEASAPPAPTPSPRLHALGSGTSVATAGGGKATVGVVTSVRKPSCGGASPGSGNVFVVVSVGYSADAGSVTYGPSDWTLRDAAGATYGPRAVECLQGPLGSGTIHQGGDAGGWVTFAAPAGAARLWIDFHESTGVVDAWPLT